MNIMKSQNHPANKKTYVKPAINTIDEKHTDMLNRFHEIDTKIIPSLKVEKEQLIEQAKMLKENQIELYMELRDKILAIHQKIKQLQQQKKEYLLNNSRYIFQYFEEKKQISNQSNNTNVIPIQKNNVLESFFKIKTSATYPKPPPPPQKNNYQQYWRNVNNEITNIQDFVISSDICESCWQGEMIPQDEEGILICNNKACGKFVTYIVDSSKPTNKEPPNEVSYTAYIRLNHFKEILSQFQAKETTQIPEAVIQAIKDRIKKERIEDTSQINYDKMREILRKLGFNKYFEHIQYINSLFGIKPPIMNEELHETLCILFIEIQKPWATHCPANRTNFFNYTYTLYQLCVLLNQTQYLPYIPMMKDREKQLEQDMIWKKVCNDLDWEFFPTV
uniref:Uncharacterized protein n=1 Tax=viral metagenome TaxID=1070528 RepID=A0A6C0I4S6_9ZZZZ